MLLCLLLCGAALLSKAEGQSNHPVVHTTYGQVQGNRTTVGNSEVDMFFKVPYAKPPLGDLRFQKPQPPQAWSGVLNAMHYGPECMREDFEDSYGTFPNSEDCLYLNIFTPKTSSSDPLPVMVWIHGGGLYLGTGNDYDGAQLAEKGVVVVTINYRLDVLGFLSTEDAVSPGNYGIWDMIRALEWIRDTISAFHGNPNDVTIFGQEMGGASVSMLVESSAASGLFHKAIMESGVSLWLGSTLNPRIDPTPTNLAVQLAQHLGCATDVSSRMITCLRNIDAQKLCNTAANLGLWFGPIPEPTFGTTGALSGLPITVMENGPVNNVPTIRGFNRDESAQWVSDQDVENDGLTEAELRKLIAEDLEYMYNQTGIPYNPTEVVANIWDLYIKPLASTDPITLRDIYTEMGTDAFDVSPAVLETRLMLKQATQPQYVYRFSYRSPNTLTPEWAGVMHQDELEYVFGAPVSGINIFYNFVSSWTDTDRQVSETMMTMWTNFAKYGDPTPGAGVNGVKWSPWTEGSENVLDITEQPQLMSNFVTPKQTFWIERFLAVLRARSGAGNSGGIVG